VGEVTIYKASGFLISYETAIFLGNFAMTNVPAVPDYVPIAAADIGEREKYIIGQPPRLAPLRPEERSEQQQRIIEKAGPPPMVRVQRVAGDNEWVEIMVRHPDLFVAHFALAQIFFSDKILPARDRELAVLRTGWLSQAPFEWGGHVPIAKASGVTAEEVERVIQGSAAAGWSKHDRALLRAAEELHNASMISDETWADLSETFNDKQLIELIMLIGQYKMVAYYQNSLRFRLPKGNDGFSAR
jgi:alkylhydroperoxidase family enzyme